MADEYDQYLKKEVHEIFAEKVDAENQRQNARIEKLESIVTQVNELTLSVKELAINMDGTLKQLALQSERLQTIEKRDGENWRKIVGTAITVVVSAVLGFVLAQLGLA